METYQKAALHMHGLSASDRQWLLAQLPESQVEPLQAMLTELDDLGIPKDPGLMTELLRVEEKYSEDSFELGAEQQDLNEIATAGTDTVISLLTKESDTVIAAVLASVDKSLRNELLEGIHEPRRQSVAKAINKVSDKLTQPTQDALIQELVKKLQEIEQLPQSHHSVETIVAAKPKQRWKFMRRLSWQR